MKRFIDLASTTPEEIDQLSAASDPATFGRGKEDVYDETYRKAVKMDASNFAVQFDPARVGLIKIIEEQLLQSQKEEMSIEAEIYKLNVYGDHLLFLKFDSSSVLVTLMFVLSRQGFILQGAQGHP